MSPFFLFQGSKMNVILSIKPKYAEAILCGEKKCEFRKNRLPRNVDRVLLYASNSIGKIVGWFTIRKQITGRPGDIWKSHSMVGGITKKEFDEYYNGHKEAVCIEIKDVTKLDPPIDPYDLLPEFVPPQSYIYLRGSDHLFLFGRNGNPNIMPLDSYNR